MAHHIRDTENLSAFESGLKAAGIFDLFFGPSNFTVLAPDNQAFESLGKEFPDLLDVVFTKPFRLHLIDLLYTHVLGGRVVLSSDMSDGSVIFPDTREEISVVKTDVSLCFSPSLDEGGACVIAADVMASNGVFHVLDQLITPIWLYYSIYQVAETALPILTDLVMCAGLDKILANTVGLTVSALLAKDGSCLCSRTCVHVST